MQCLVGTVLPDFFWRCGETPWNSTNGPHPKAWMKGQRRKSSAKMEPKRLGCRTVEKDMRKILWSVHKCVGSILLLFYPA